MILGKRLSLRGTVMRARSLDEKRVVAAAFARDVVPLLRVGGARGERRQRLRAVGDPRGARAVGEQRHVRQGRGADGLAGIRS